MAELPLIESELISGERIIWKGRPASGIRFRQSDIAFIPFTFLWGGFAIFWEFSAITQDGEKSVNGIPFVLWGIPFVLMGLYLMFGRFVIDAWQRRNTDYALTSQRAIIRSGLFSTHATSVNLKSMPDMSVTEKADGSGTIAFGEATTGYSSRMPRGMAWPGASHAPAFEMIDDVRRVQGLIRRAMDEAS